jgi:hypothetical protein
VSVIRLAPHSIMYERDEIFVSFSALDFAIKNMKNLG